MRFTLISEKTPLQCIRAIKERLEQSETKTRPGLEGFADRESGGLSMSMETRVLGRFKRRTRLRGTIKKEEGETRIRGFVPEGMSRDRVIIVGVFVLALAIFMFVQQQFIYAILIVMAGGALAIPLLGDHHNHDQLLYELEKATKAKPPSGKRTSRRRKK